MALLRPDEPPAFTAENVEGRFPCLLLCEHASNRIPRALGDLGLLPGEIDRHIGWDIGALVMARRLSRLLDAALFATGAWIALPLLTMLLFVNFVLGAISRVAPQINVFAVGFPVTLAVGLLGMLLTLPALQGPFTLALERMLGNFR